MGTNGQHASKGAFTVGEWRVEPARNVISRDGEVVHLEPRVMDVLVYLTSRCGEVVLKDELADHVWEGRHVTDEVLTVSIYSLRKALGDQARQPRYIETIARRGYRWVAAVGSGAGLVGASEPRPSRRTGRRLNWVAAALALLIVSAAGVLTLRPTGHLPSSEAHEAYVKGRHFLDQRSLDALQKALEQFEHAAALDPLYPAAHAGIADTYSSMSDFGVASAEELRPRAMAAAQRALEMDSRSAEGLAALGRAQFLFDWDFAGPVRYLEQAVQIAPDYMPAHQALGWLRSARGENEMAVAAARRALQLDPANIARYHELGWVLSLGGRHDDALREFDRARQLNPRRFESYSMKGWTYGLAGKPDAAFAAYREGMQAAGAPPDALQRLDGIYRTQGLAGVYRLWLNPKGGGRMPMSETFRALVYVRMGDVEQAIAALEKALQKRESALAWVNVDPGFQPLRADARFQRIARQVTANRSARL